MAEQDDANFPGLDKRHGFFKAIERNQRDRDHYHHEWEEWKESRQGVVKKEWREARRRPPKALYRPPHSRGAEEQRPRPPLYKLELEIEPHQWVKLKVKFGESEKAVGELATRYHLGNVERQALREIITEYEQTFE